jgi:N-acetylmuramoyl-L-alanine amidase
MRWNKRLPAAPLAAILLLMQAATPADEKQLSVYGPQLSYSIPLQQRNGTDYVGLLEAMEPLGTVNITISGNKLKLRFNRLEAEFHQGANQAKIAGKKLGLATPFLLENNRGLVPLRSLPEILRLLLGAKPEYHESARRLFLGGVGTRFNTELRDTGLTVSFSAPVNPMISTEPGKLKMSFSRDPVVSSPYSQKFDNPLVSAISFSENNGRAELNVQGKVPLLARFGADGKTIEVVAAPTQPVASQPAPAIAGPAPPAATPAVSRPPAVTLASLTAKPLFQVMVDAGHGGDDRGALLSETLQEKDVTLAIARRVRGELQSRGISAIMSRDADVTVSSEQRAAMADAARVAVYLSLHAGSQPRGVRVYTALMAQGDSKRPAFIPWESAQAGYVTTSRALADVVKTELGKREIPVAELQAPVRPLSNVAAVALAVEVSPSGEDASSVTSSVYQQRVAGAIAEAIMVERARVDAGR